MQPLKNIIIALDGHSSCGKSTVAKQIAQALSIAYIDTGAMYRAVTLAALQAHLINNNTPDTQAITRLLPSLNITFNFDPQKARNTTFLNGQNVEDQIRDMPVSQNVSAISAIPAVRAQLTQWQQRIGSQQSVIMDGRDIGTTVFPNADLKIFMTARPEIRAQRRLDEMRAKGQDPNFDDILANILQRDQLDTSRPISPLRQAPDAITLDNSDMTPQQQFDFIINTLLQKGLIQ